MASWFSMILSLIHVEILLECVVRCSQWVRMSDSLANWSIIGGMSKYNPFVLLMGIAEKYAYSKSDEVVCVAPFSYKHMLKHGLQSVEKYTYISNGISLNDWNESLMQTFLTGDYYNRTGEAASNGLKASAKERIEDAIFYLGGGTDDPTTHYGSTEEVYAWERGTEVYNETRPTSWEGKVALMYPSDMYMTYGNGVNATCYNDPKLCNSASLASTGWIYNSNVLEGAPIVLPAWFLSPFAGNFWDVFLANSDGYLDDFPGDEANGVRPVVYLKSDIQIFDGDGTSGNPYKL